MRRLPPLLLVFAFVSPSFIAQTDNGCKLKFLGKPIARKAVKLHPPTKEYPYKDVDAISVKEFLNPLRLEVRKKVFCESSHWCAMPIEEQTIKIRAFVLAMKLDIHPFPNLYDSGDPL